MLERLAARALTGPLGHFVGGVIDWAVFGTRYLRARASGRDPWS